MERTRYWSETGHEPRNSQISNMEMKRVSILKSKPLLVGFKRCLEYQQPEKSLVEKSLQERLNDPLQVLPDWDLPTKLYEVRLSKTMWDTDLRPLQKPRKIWISTPLCSCFMTRLNDWDGGEASRAISSLMRRTLSIEIFTFQGIWGLVSAEACFKSSTSPLGFF